jgi:hypothetical protein
LIVLRVVFGVVVVGAHVLAVVADVLVVVWLLTGN